ncbi:MAG TPA: hypothetical protein VFZ24_02895 [Longimicrobiales bacterium]
MPLDFASAARLFMGTEEELAAALGIPIADLRDARTNPQRVTPDVLRRFGRLLEERGRGMIRVGEMLLEDNPEGRRG